MLGLSEVGIQDAHAANEDHHLGRGQRQQLGFVDQQRLSRYAVLALDVIAEAIGDRLKNGERFDISLFLRSVHASRCERHLHRNTGFLRCLLDARATGKHDQVGE